MKTAKRLLVEIVILLALFALVIVLIEKQYSGYKTDADVVMEEFFSKKDQAENLITGNSHMLALVTELPEAEQKNVASLSYGGLDIFWMTVLLKKYIPEMPQLKDVYINIEEELLGYNQSYFKQDYANRAFYRYTDTLYEMSLSNVMQARNNFFRTNRDIGFLFGRANQNSLHKMLQLAQIPMNEEGCRKRAKEHSIIRFNKKLADENLLLLSEIIAVCQLHHITLHPVILPKASCYYHFRNNDNIIYSRKRIDSLFIKTGISIQDFQREELPDTFFRDPDHLNEQGAEAIFRELFSKN